MSDIPAAFDFLHRQTLRSWSNDGYLLWFPTVRLAKDYSIGIHAAAAPVSSKASAVVGDVIIPENALILHATKSEFPFEPEGMDLFYWGPSVEEGKKYQILTASSAHNNHSHYRITAVFASRG